MHALENPSQWLLYREFSVNKTALPSTKTKRILTAEAQVRRCDNKGCDDPPTTGHKTPPPGLKHEFNGRRLLTTGNAALATEASVTKQRPGPTRATRAAMENKRLLASAVSLKLRFNKILFISFKL